MREAEFRSQGFVVVRDEGLAPLIEGAAVVFEAVFLPLFTDDVARNRTVIKRFGDSFEVARIFASPQFEAVCQSVGVKRPVFCGPTVTHYTSTNETGNAFGLPFHQDWPSMASADNALILWTSITDCGPASHGMEVVPGSHRQGLLPGLVEAHGYVLVDQEFTGQHVLETKLGDVVLMSPFLAHRTFVNPAYRGWKLSLSRRVDDLECPAWKRRGYRNAYSTNVDRALYQQ